MAAPRPAEAQLITVPPPLGINGEVVVAAPPGGTAIVYRVGLLGLFTPGKLNQVSIRISPLAAPLSAGLTQSDITQLRLIESTNTTFGDGDDVLLNTLPSGSIDIAGGVTTITDGGNATTLGLFVGQFFRFYFIVADLPTTARTGNALRLGADANHINTSVPSNIGGAITAQNANRVVVTKLVPVLAASPASLSFGNVLVLSSSSLPVTISNNGAANLTVTDITDGDFSADVTSFTVTPGGSQLVNVDFTPTSAGFQSTNLAITHNDTLASIVTNYPVDGTGISPTIDVSPSSLAFGDVLLGTSPVLAVTVQNLGTATLNVTNITSTDGDYVPSITSFSVAPAGSQVVNVTFTPSSTGAHPSTLSIVHDDQLTGSPSTVPITGTGIDPVIGVTPTSLAYGNVQVGASSDLTVTVSNTGSTDLVVSGVTSDDGQFVPDITSFTVTPGNNQAITVTYTPGGAGADSGTLSLVHNAAGSPSTVSMSGTGVTPGISVSPTSLAFGNVAVGGSSMLALTVTNTGTSTLNVTNVTADDGQYVPDITSFSVAPAGNQVVNVTFTPTATGSQPATLSIDHDAAGSPTAVPLSGTGTSPDIDVSPTSLAYGNVAVGSPSVLSVTVTNTGGATLTVSSVTSNDGQFVGSPTSFSVAPGNNQVINVTFTPAADGAQSGTLSIVHNATGSPATVPMSGTGTSGAISVSPTSLAFGNVVVGASKNLILTVSNPGTGSLSVTNITPDDAQFSATPTSFTVAPGGNRLVTVTFTPSATGAQSGNLSIDHSATGSPQVVPVSGTGTAPVFGVTPGSLAYGSVAIGSPSVLSVTVSNTGTASLNVTSVTSDDGQFVPDITSFSVAPAGSQVVNVTFTPSAEGLQSGTLSLVHSAAGSPGTVSMNGTGTSPGFALSPTSLSFGAVALGSSSILAVTITNGGNLSLNVTNITSGAPQFVPDITSFTVPAMSNQVVNVTFTPTSSATLNSALTITHNATGSPGTLPVSGSGANPGISVSKQALAIGNVVLGATGIATFRIRNVGGSTLNVTDISSSNTTFVPDVTSVSLAPGAQQFVTVTFTPDALADESGILFITHDAVGGLVEVPLTGSGTVDVQALSASFGQVSIGGFAVRAIAVRNPDAAPVIVTSVADNPRFAVTTPSLTIAAGATDSVRVVFRPTKKGEQTGTLQISHNPTISVSLSGTTPQLSGTGSGAASPRLKPFEVPFGGEVLMVIALALYALFRRTG